MVWMPRKLRRKLRASLLGETDEVVTPSKDKAGDQAEEGPPPEAREPETREDDEEAGVPAPGDAVGADETSESGEARDEPYDAFLHRLDDAKDLTDAFVERARRLIEESDVSRASQESEAPEGAPAPGDGTADGAGGETAQRIRELGEAVNVAEAARDIVIVRRGAVIYRPIPELDEAARKIVDQETALVRETVKDRAVSLFYLALQSTKKTPVDFESPDEEAAYMQGVARRALSQAIEELAEIELRISERGAERLIGEILQVVTGYGAIEPLLQDDTVSEVMINGPKNIFVERAGKLYKTRIVFEDDVQLMRMIHKIVSPLGRRVDRSVPTCDARLPDGSRVNIVLPPLALNGPTVTIRRFARKALSMEDLMAKGSLSRGMLDFLRGCIRLKLNIVVSGGTGSGKTTTLNVLSSCIPDGERIVTLEDAAELSLQQDHIVGLESRPPNLEGMGEVTLRALLRNALRMRPDRIVVGECRGAEALDMLQAMNTGHEGSMTTGHANTPRDMIGRLETMVLMGGMPLTSRTIREQIARSVDLIVQQSRMQDGTRKIVSISEVLGVRDGQVELVEIFRFEKKGLEDGVTLGEFVFTGTAPSFLHRFREEGVPLPRDVFGEETDVEWLMDRVIRERDRQARQERREMEELVATATGEVPYEQSSLMMSIRGLRVIDWKNEMCQRLPGPPPAPRHFSDFPAPLLGSTQLIGEKEILGPMRRWMMRELMTRIKRLVAFEKLELEFDSLEEEREVLREKLRYCFEDCAQEYNIRLGPAALDAVLKEALRDAAGLGPIQPLLDDEGVDEVMVNGPRQIWVERRGKLHLTSVEFRDDDHVMQIVERILTRVNRRVDRSVPIADARLQDGSRVNVVIPPISLVGPTLTIRKFSKKPLLFKDLVKKETLSKRMAKLLEACVKAKVSLVVAGGTGSGKTSTLNALSGFIPSGERIVTIEDAAELQLQQPHVVPLESRPASREGTAAVTIRDLVRNALRMRPDRVVIGECRGPEALDMLQAMNTGHEGSMTSAHANTPRDLVGRIETMVMMGNIPLTSRAIREQILSAVQLVIQQERLPDGSRKITAISEFTGIAGEGLVVADIFRYRRSAASRLDEDAPDRFEPAGHFPRFLEELSHSGVPLPDDLFGPDTSIARELERRERLRAEEQKESIARSNPSADSGEAAPLADGRPPFRWTGAMPAVRRPSRAVQESRLGQAGAREKLEESRAREKVHAKRDITRTAIAALALLEAPSRDEIVRTVKDCVRTYAEEHPEMELPRALRRQLMVEVADEVGGLGPIQPLVEDPDISEVMVNGPYQVYVERKGRIELSSVVFRDDEHALHVLNRILAPTSRRCDVKQPLVDARLADGSRVNAAIPPVALNGPVLTIRKFSGIPFDLDLLVEMGAMPAAAGDFLKKCVRLGLNMVISGGTGSGKTTLLNALSGEIPEGERVVTIEDSAELALQVDHVVGLEARPQNLEGRGAVTVRDLVKNALRMRPDRIVVGECRGAEALDMLQAMNTGHEGSMTTAHANNTRELIARIETMVLMAGSGATIRGIREQIAGAVDLVVQQRRLPDGRRRVVQVTEVLGIDGEEIRIQDLFLWRSEGVDEQGRQAGELAPTGILPSFLARMRMEGHDIDESVFLGVEHAGEKRLRTIRQTLESSGIRWPF